VTTRDQERRRRLTQRGLPALAALAALALLAGVVLGARELSGNESAAREFTSAWERSDYAAMHRLLTPAVQRRVEPSELRRAYERAAATATTASVDALDPKDGSGGRVIVPIALRTRVFGALRRELELPVADGRVAWTEALAFPGLKPGARLTRTSDVPERGALLSRNRKVIARGPAEARVSPLGPLSGSIAGSLSPEETPRERLALYARGFPRDQPVGQNGLELAFEPELAGRPGGQLVAGGRVIARSRPRKAAPVLTTLDPKIQEAAVAALAGRFGGIAAIDARTAEVRALAGVAFSAPQPPGSTFKIVTATAALEAGLVKPSTKFPVVGAATIDGVELENANGEFCGGSFQSSFAHSCNSVFAPLGVKVGAERLVETAERYGFNGRPAVPGELTSSLPPASQIKTPLEVGSTAIGQGKVLATPLRLASVAQTIAAGGVLSEPTLRPREPQERPRRVTSRQVAATIERLMVDVVAYGTGTAAAIQGVKVAGKTGTAELEDTRGPGAEDQAPDASNTDAWFTAYAPAGKPRIAVGVLLVRAGAGGATAAPAARTVLEAGLR
jgi:penicillin-binding protein A